MKEIKRSVLIVDDVSQILDRLESLLAETDSIHKISKASSFSEAILLLNEQQYDIVLLDIHLPDKNGIELLGFIKKRFPQIIVLMLTNQTGRHYRKLCMDLGARHFIDKSKEFDRIPDLIDSL
ncbi:MAG: response regulator transcription factor [Ferruginibacter sp.]